MPFGLIDALATFQSLMNDIFHTTLRRYVLVFFDDILIYSKTCEEHLVHLTMIFDTLLQNQLYVNRSKCLFGQQKVDYLGHIISSNGVSIDPKKIQSMESWPTPTTIIALRGFLGLIEYYQKFIQGYGVTATPLTSLLKKDGFKWTQEATEAFQQLKRAMVQAPVLALPNFTKKFIVEADASGNGLGAVLTQDGRPIAFYSKALSIHALGRSINEKKLMAIVKAIHKWRIYLLSRKFLISTDHHSLKYLLEQWITTPDQQKWIVKLMGFDYEIEYKQGNENKAADALSRLPRDLLAVSCPKHAWVDVIRDEACNHPDLAATREAVTRGDLSAASFTVKDGLLWHKGKVVLPPTSQFK